MRHRRVQWLVVVGVLIGLAGSFGCGRKAAERSWSGGEPIAAEDLRETEVLPHPYGPIIPGKNYVYCATFQLAWNQFQDDVMGEPIDVTGWPQVAQDLARGSGLTIDVLPPGSYLVKAGLVEDGVVDDIREEMAERFPNATVGVPEDVDAADNVAVAYAYLQRALEFGEVYDRLDDPIEFPSEAGPVNVACFGVRDFKEHSDRDRTLAEQVSVLAYASDDDFVLRLNTKAEDDEIVLAKVESEGTLAATLAAVRKRIEGAPSKYAPGLIGGESLVVPVIDLNVRRKYTELEGRSPGNPEWSGLYLGAAEQTVRFRLDETGARAESDAYQAWESPMKEEPGQYIFDKPFLIYLKRKSADEPYLAMWVETPEVLEKAE